MRQQDIFRKVLLIFSEGLELLQYLDDKKFIEMFKKSLGIENLNQDTIDNIINLTKGLSSVIDELSDGEGDYITLFADLSSQIKEILEVIDSFKDFNPHLDPNKLANNFLGFIVSNHLRSTLPLTAAILSFLGVLEDERAAWEQIYMDGQGIDPITSFVQPNFHPIRIVEFLKSPEEWIEKVYGWNLKFDFQKFSANVFELLGQLGLNFDYYIDSSSNNGGKETELRFSILQRGSITEDAYFDIGIIIANSEGVIFEKRGLQVTLYSIGENLEIKEELDEFEIYFATNFNLNGGIKLVLEPKLPPLLFIDAVQEPDEVSSIDIEAGLKRTDDEIKYWLDNGSLKLGSLNEFIKIGISGDLGDDSDVVFEFGFDEFKLIIDASRSDNFLKSIISSPFEVGIGFSMGWSKNRGLFLGNGSGLAFNIALYKEFGPILIKNISTELELDSSKGSSLSFLLSFNFSLGIIKATVGNIGVKANFIFDGGWNNIFSGFKFIPPTSIGISLQSSLITGTGYLENDPDKHRYAGLLNLSFQAFSLTAIGLITTRLPNGKKGYSMLVSISATFSPGIQLGYGFSLTGAGGLLGINRTMRVDVLRDRMQSGAIDSILFPENVAENADRIISDLRAVFPPEEKHYVMAPFFQIQWGADGMLEIELGALVELPFKGQLILLGSLNLYLPQKEAAKVKIHIDILGDLNFASRYISLEGVLYDSELVGIPIEGGFANLLSWGDQPEFLMSIGGYHPRYQKPKGFPEISRLTAYIQKGENIRLFCDLYHAITSNTFQIGFNAGLEIKKGKFNVAGNFGFNALLQFDPLYFEVDVNLSVNLRYKKVKLAGVDLYFLLTGPAPWKASGRATIKVLWVKKTLKFSYEWGAPQKIQPAYVEAQTILDNLKSALERPNNWSANLSEGFQSAEILLPQEEINIEGLVLHPSGYLEMRQSVVPLGLPLGKNGTAKVKGHPEFWITPEQNGMGDKPFGTPLQEYFAIGQLIELNDAEKLFAPDFEKMDAGFRFNGEVWDGFDLGKEIEMDLGAFEMVNLVEEREEDSTSTDTVNHDFQVQRAILRRGAHKRKTAQQFYHVSDDLPAIGKDTYETVNVFSSHSDKSNKLFGTYAHAHSYLTQQANDDALHYRVRKK